MSQDFHTLSIGFYFPRLFWEANINIPVQFPHFWTEIGKWRNRLEDLAQADLRSRGVKTAARGNWRDGRTAASPGVSRVGRETGAGKNHPRRTPRLRVRGRSPSRHKGGLNALRRKEKSKSRAGGEGQVPNKDMFCRQQTASQSAFCFLWGVIQPHCQLLGARRKASHG